MKKNLLLRALILLVLASMLLAACGGEESYDESMDESPAAESSDEAAEEAPAASGDIVAAFKFANSGDADFCELYVSPTGMDEWGDEQLKGKTLPAGGEITMTKIPAGTYDIMVIGCDGETENVIPDVSITNQ